jgi:RNA polymerase sigma-70 factor (ECF subfamily)
VSRTESTANSLNLPEIVDLVRSGDPAGLEKLYSVFARGVRFYLWRQLGPQDLDDKVHDTFLMVVQAIQRDEIREPERLMGFVRTIVRRQVAAHIDRAVQNRRRQVNIEAGLELTDCNNNPESGAMERQERELMISVLQGMSQRDRDILTRFYLLNHSQERICREMGLSSTQFRLLKSRAKMRFGLAGRRKLKRRLTPDFLRIVPGWGD